MLPMTLALSSPLQSDPYDGLSGLSKKQLVRGGSTAAENHVSGADQCCFLFVPLIPSPNPARALHTLPLRRSS